MPVLIKNFSSRGVLPAQIAEGENVSRFSGPHWPSALPALSPALRERHPSPAGIMSFGARGGTYLVDLSSGEVVTRLTEVDVVVVNMIQRKIFWASSAEFGWWRGGTPRA